MQKAKNTKQNQKDNHKSLNPVRIRPQIAKTDSNQIWLYGTHSVLSALQKKRRKVFQILVTKNSAAELEKFLQHNNLQKLADIIKLTDNDHINSVVGRDQIHQGIAASCSRLAVKNQNDLLEELYKLKKTRKLKGK